jgi:effector-binding domain-containing protein
MAYEVEFVHVEPCPTAVVRLVAKQSELSRVVPEACGTVWNFLRAEGVKGAGRHVAVYFDGVINLEVGVELASSFESDGNVVASQTPGGWVATAVHIGPYGGLGGAHQAILAWCAGNGRTLAGPSWEIYGHMTPDGAAPPRTDVFYLLEESADPLVGL